MKFIIYFFVILIVNSLLLFRRYFHGFFFDTCILFPDDLISIRTWLYKTSRHHRQTKKRENAYQMLNIFRMITMIVDSISRALNETKRSLQSNVCQYRYWPFELSNKSKPFIMLGMLMWKEYPIGSKLNLIVLLPCKILAFLNN